MNTKYTVKMILDSREMNKLDYSSMRIVYRTLIQSMNGDASIIEGSNYFFVLSRNNCMNREYVAGQVSKVTDDYVWLFYGVTADVTDSIRVAVRDIVRAHALYPVTLEDVHRMWCSINDSSVTL